VPHEWLTRVKVEASLEPYAITGYESAC